MALTLIDLKEVSALVELSPLYIRKLVKEKRFPTPLFLPIPHAKRPKLYFCKFTVMEWAKARIVKKVVKRGGGRGGMGTGPEETNPADMGGIQRTLLSLSARVKALEGQVARLSADQSEPAWQYPDDGCTMTGAERDAMQAVNRNSNPTGSR